MGCRISHAVDRRAFPWIRRATEVFSVGVAATVPLPVPPKLVLPVPPNLVRGVQSLAAAEVIVGKRGVEDDCGDPPSPGDVGDGNANGRGDLDSLKSLVIGIVNAILEQS